MVAIGAGDIDAGETEYGWTDDNDAAGDSIAHRDDELDDGNLPALGADDGEGTDERVDETSDDADLPPLDAGENEAEASQDADLAGLGRIEFHDAEPERYEMQPGLSWAWFPRSRVKLTERDLAATGPVVRTQQGAVLVDGTSLITLGTGKRLDLRSRITGVTSGTDLEELAVSASNGLWRVTPAGITGLGGPSADPTLIFEAAIARTAGQAGPTLWAQSRLGSLFRLAEQPDRWTLVDAPRPGQLLASDDRRNLAYICTPTRRPSALVRSDDGGQT
jgi:hypothetical protein